MRESLVLLKNEHGLLPLSAKLNVLVAGDGADDMGKQTGGWTISWQGTGNARADFPRAQTIFEGIAEQVRAGGGQATLARDGGFTAKPDVAIVVFGEDPYAEFMGDRDNLAFEPGDPRDLRLIRDLRAKGVPVVAVFLAGRPLYVTREINAADAFVAAWLPGTEGGGVADLLFRPARARPPMIFAGGCPFPGRARPTRRRSIGRPNATAAERTAYNPLFAFGYGLDYAHPRDLGVLPEAPGGDAIAANVDRYLDSGHAAPPWSLAIVGGDGASAPVLRLPANTPALTLASTDHLEQGGHALGDMDRKRSGRARAFRAPVDLSRQTNGDMALRLALRIDEAPAGQVDARSPLRKILPWNGRSDRRLARGAGQGLDDDRCAAVLLQAGRRRHERDLRTLRADEREPLRAQSFHGRARAGRRSAALSGRAAVLDSNGRRRSAGPGG
ncbi:MAG: glycoside hydrolase family 3 C-terminal domain-containing protein [Rhizomicrobium sp.]